MLSSFWDLLKLLEKAIRYNSSMKITKFVHSCLLVETDEETVLFDPGRYSWKSGLFAIEKLKKLDAMVITHEHDDHFHIPFVEALIKKFPNASFTTTVSVAKQLQVMGITRVFTESNGNVQIFSKKRHASVEPLKAPPPENIAVHYANRLTVGGDRQDLEESKEILALTITAPWGSERTAAQMLLRLHPKYAIPIHDWHWSEAARNQEYDRFEEFARAHDITILKPIDGKPIEV